ncbi:MAG: aspartyl protease family protein [Isosphaeraceae bacterium]|nr:aspartyl protease family protein [Isosphaeraceae bacterium]
MKRRLTRLGLLLAAAALAPDDPKKAPDTGRPYQVPYRLTDTNHFLVRVRINGKGPFNFLVDTGAPALFIATDTARKIGLEPTKEFWTPVDRIDFEGGAHLSQMKARVEDPFQLVGMNALGLPGASIDGILGFTVLARFRMEIDPTRDRMTWTRLDYEPKDLLVPPTRDEAGKPPAGVQAMNLLGPLAKLAAAMTGGKQPEEQLHARGFLGLELSEQEGEVRVARVVPGSPAAKAGVEPRAQLVEVGGKTIKTLKDALTAVADVRAGGKVTLGFTQGKDHYERTVTAGEGL